MVNSRNDALKIIKDYGIMMRIQEGMHSNKDQNMTLEANRIFKDILGEVK